MSTPEEATRRIKAKFNSPDSPAEGVEEQRAAKDAAYLERNRLVALLASLYPSGIARTAIPGWSDDWHGCVYIDLPNGQASWHYHDSHAHLFAHLPPYVGKWDGHTTEEKYARIAALAVLPPSQGEAGENALRKRPLTGELADAMRLANRVLDRINSDPDDDLALLSRQFLRNEEKITTLLAMLQISKGQRESAARMVEAATDIVSQETAAKLADRIRKGQRS